MANLGFPFDPDAVARPCSYADLPDLPAIQRLKSCRQWVVWRYEDRGKAKPTKVPYQPGTGFNASVSTPHHWGTYDQAVARAERGRFDGIGFVLSADDDLTGIDLDHCRDPNTGDLEPLAQRVADLAETYCEVTPSETGLRLIVEGKIASALKRDPVGVEMYGKGRYLTITGWHLAGTPTEIAPAPKTLEALREAVAAFDAAHAAKAAEEVPAIASSGPVATPLPIAEAGGSPFFRNVNSAALASLPSWVPAVFGAAARFHPGTGAFRVSSKSLGRNLEEDLSIAPNGIRDWGVGDMGDARQGARTPIDLVMEYGFEKEPRGAAVWLCQQMGKSPEAFGWEEGDRGGAEIAATLLARKVVEAEDGTLADAETGEVIETASSPSDDPLADDYAFGDISRPDGLIAEMTEWILATSRRPNRPLAMTAAIAVMCGICSRHMMGPTNSATHLYLVNLGATSVGKDRPFKAMDQILTAAGFGSIYQSAKFKSDTAIELALKSSITSVAGVDEIGSAIFAKMGGRRATTHESSISAVLRELWSVLPGDTWQTSSRAGERSEKLQSPAMTIMGASTLNEFYKSLTGASVDNGFLNRFTVIMAAPASEEQDEQLDRRIVPASITQKLAAILPRSGNIEALNALLGPSHPAEVLRIEWANPAVGERHLEFSRRITRWRDEDDNASPFLGRTAEMAVRLATVHAVGRAGRTALVTDRDYRWGASVALASARFMIEDASLRMSETDYQSNLKFVLAFLKQAGRAKRMEITRKVDGRWDPGTTDKILRSLAEGGQIGLVKGDSTKEGGRKPDIYVYLKEKRART